MAPLDLFIHLINFLAPALAVGAALALVGPWLMKKRPSALGPLAQVAINFIAGALALGLGLWFFGNDGKMASYAVMVMACAFSQGLALRR
jgi:hypothetical protein